MVKTSSLRVDYVVKDLAILRILGDPMRVRLLAQFQPPGMTVKEAAFALNTPPAKLYYHVDLLASHGLLEVCGRRIVSGITEKRYLCPIRKVKLDRSVLSFDQSNGALDALLSATIDATRAEAERSAADGLLQINSDTPLAAGMFSRRLLKLSAKGAAKALEAIQRTLDEAANLESSQDCTDYFNLTVGFFPVGLPASGGGETGRRRPRTRKPLASN